MIDRKEIIEAMALGMYQKANNVFGDLEFTITNWEEESEQVKNTMIALTEAALDALIEKLPWGDEINNDDMIRLYNELLSLRRG